ncbi:MAG: hypothetical protein ACLFM0_00395 [Spirochaetales bacterium]
MSRKHRSLWFLAAARLAGVALTGMVILAGCSNLFGRPDDRDSRDRDPGDSEQTPDDDTSDDDTSASDLTANEGTVGMIVDVRELARLGYAPQRVSFEFTDEFTDLSGEVDVDPMTSVATFQKSRSEFTETEISALGSGVEVEVRVYDEKDDELESQVFSAPVDSSNRFFAIDTNRPRQFPAVALDPDTPYLLQAIAPGSPVDGYLYKLRTSSIDLAQPLWWPVTYANDFNIEDVSRLPLYSFYFEEKFQRPDDGLHWLKLLDLGPNPGDELYVALGSGDYLYTFESANSFQAFGPIDIRMKVEQDDNGLLRIDPLPIGSTSRLELLRRGGEDLVGISNTSSSTYIPVRPIAADVDWDVEFLGTEFSPPILPPAKLDFATRTTIENCSDATINQTVGQKESYTRSTTMSTSESLELFSSATETTSVTTSVEVGGAFKGLGASASVEATEEWSYTTSETTTSSNTFSATDSKTIEVFNERTVNVPPNTAIEAYDAVASFDNVRLPFVKVVRVRGNRSGGGAALSGNQIVTQLVTSQFGGVITNVRSDYVDVTIRGTATVQNYFETQIGTRRLPGGCD